MRAEREFRALQHGGPHPLHGVTPSVDENDVRWRDPPPADPNADRRVVAHFDADCFYAQVEELCDPNLASRPVAVTQKYLVVTANYAARKAGVGKLVSVAEAKRLCPDAAFVCGEDLTPYREFSKRIRRVLARFGACEKLGLDECWVDVTDEVDRRLAGSRGGDGDATGDANVGHRLVAGAALASSNRHRPTDLRIVAGAFLPTTTSPNAARGDARTERERKEERRVRVGAAVAAEARAAVLAETGVRCSAGVAVNKMLAKLVSGAHKPDDQTYLPPGFRVGASLVAPLATRALPGVGAKTAAELARRGVKTCADARRHARETLVAWLGARAGASVHDAAWGVDRSEVVAKAPQQAVTCQDSFRTCEGAAAARRALAALAPDLVRRMDEERDEREPPRVAGRLVVRWREKPPTDRATGSTGSTGSVSLPMPAAAADARLETEARADAVVAAAARALASALPKTFTLTLLAVGATAFRDVCARPRDSTRRLPSRVSRERALSSFFARDVSRAAADGKDGDRTASVADEGDDAPVLRAASKREAREKKRAGTRKRDFAFFSDFRAPRALGALSAGGGHPTRRNDDPDPDPVAERSAVADARLERDVRDSARDDACSDEEDDCAAFFADLADTIAGPERRRGARPARRR